MQRAVPRVDQEADSPSALEQQIAGDPRGRDQPLKQEDDHGAKKDPPQLELPQLLEINR